MYQKKNVLVVDDDLDLLATLKLYFRRSGIKASFAASGEEALQIALGETELGLVLLDVFLPGTDGIDLAGRLLARRPGLKVLFKSAFLCPGMSEIVGSGDPQRRFIQKHFSGKTLIGRISRASAPI